MKIADAFSGEIAHEHTYPKHPWKKKFAFFPKRFNNQTVWLTAYYMRLRYTDFAGLKDLTDEHKFSYFAIPTHVEYAKTVLDIISENTYIKLYESKIVFRLLDKIGNFFLSLER